jgi:hypothetical protein
MAKKGLYISAFIIFLIGVVSCEEDFTDIGSSVINNTKFNTKDTIIEVVITNKEITTVRGDGLSIGGSLGQYLLGVYNNPNYEKIEASIVSQLNLDYSAQTVDVTYGADTTVVTTIDTVFLKLPYQATLKTGTTSDFSLDSIIGDQTKAFNLNLYQIDTYLSRLNPTDPSKVNNYQSNAIYEKIAGELNANVNFQFIPNAKDTALILKRKLSTGVVYKTDTLKLTNNSPFARVPLDKNKIKQLFIDKFETSDFESQEAFSQYFKGLFIEASGTEGSLISFNINGSSSDLRPSIEIHYTKTVLKGGTTVIDTLQKTNSFPLSSFSNSIYKMTEKVYPADKNIILQGTAGSVAEIKILGGDGNNNNIADLEELRNKKWLINDASLTFYVNKDVVGTDTISSPYKLFLYKKGDIDTQIKDVLSEGPSTYGGRRELEDKKPNKYNFRITDYISDLLGKASTNNSTLGLKVLNSIDLPQSISDTIVTNYSWNPKAVTLLNHFPTNGERRAQLKISYTEKK